MDKFSQYLKMTPLTLDGGMGSELEQQNINVDNNLWSASALIQSPGTIAKIHQHYFDAGAQGAITDTYQAHVATFLAQGFDSHKAYELIDTAVHLAKEGLALSTQDDGLIIGSVGPYGAYLANGAEYTGDYHLSKQAYQDFHRQRIERLVQDGVDLIGLETMPNFTEAQALSELLETEFPETPAYLSFSIKDGNTLCDGTSLATAVGYFEKYAQIKAIGVNCTAPDNILTALQAIQPQTTKQIIIYPNAGDTYDPQTKQWVDDYGPIDWQELVPQWLNQGATIIGGCCRTTPKDITAIKQAIDSWCRKV